MVVLAFPVVRDDFLVFVRRHFDGRDMFVHIGLRPVVMLVSAGNVPQTRENHDSHGDHTRVVHRQSSDRLDRREGEDDDLES